MCFFRLNDGVPRSLFIRQTAEFFLSKQGETEQITEPLFTAGSHKDEEFRLSASVQFINVKSLGQIKALRFKASQYFFLPA